MAAREVILEYFAGIMLAVGREINHDILKQVVIDNARLKADTVVPLTNWSIEV